MRDNRLAATAARLQPPSTPAFPSRRPAAGVSFHPGKDAAALRSSSTSTKVRAWKHLRGDCGEKKKAAGAVLLLSTIAPARHRHRHRLARDSQPGVGSAFTHPGPRWQVARPLPHPSLLRLACSPGRSPPVLPPQSLASWLPSSRLRAAPGKQHRSAASGCGRLIRAKKAAGAGLTAARTGGWRG